MGTPWGAGVGCSRGAPRGAAVRLPCRDTCCVPQRRGTGDPHSQVLPPTGNTLPRGCVFWGAVGLHVPRARHQGTSPGWGSAPCPASPMRGAWGAARMMAPPASMALAPERHGLVPSAGTGDGDRSGRARGHLPQPQPPPEVPNSCPGVPLSAACVC